MAIWIKNKNNKTVLAPYSYEKTIVSYNIGGSDKLIIWLEGVNTNFSFQTQQHGNKYYIPNSNFGICGGPINTNAGISFNKKQLLEIINSMKDDTSLKIAACSTLYLKKGDLQYSHGTTVEETFQRDNNMIQINDSSFAPKETVKEFLETNITNIGKDYIDYCKQKVND